MDDEYDSLGVWFVLAVVIAVMFGAITAVGSCTVKAVCVASHTMAECETKPP